MKSRVIANSTKSNKYSVENHTFPSNLFGSNAEEYAKCWVMFNINIMKNSKSPTGGGIVDINGTPEAIRGQYGQTQAAIRGMSVAETTGTLVTAAAGAAAWNEIRTGQSLTNTVAAGAKGGIAGLLLGSAVISSGTATRETKRIKTAIQLPMPNEFIVADNQQWDSDSTAVIDMMLRAGQGIIDAVTSGNIQGGGKDLLGDAITGAGLGMSGLAGSGAISAASGLAANPKKEMIYSGPGFRGFNLVYQLFPKDKKESENIHNIIKTFRYHMYPEYHTAHKFTYIYPSEFDIIFFADSGKENKYITRISTCVLSDISVQYTPTGLWAAHEEGAPAALSLQLSFKEIGIHTKDSIEAGF